MSEEDSALHSLIRFIIWLTGILVSLAVGFGMINQTLTIPYIPEFITTIAGWLVVSLSVLALILAVVERFGK